MTQNNNKLTAVVFTVVMIFSMIAVGGASATPSAPTSGIADTDAVTDPAETDITTNSVSPTSNTNIAESVQNATGETEIILLLEQPDVDPTVGGTEYVRSLQSETDSVQNAVTSELRSLDGVQPNSQFWIVNAVTATVDFDETTVDELRAIDGVRAIAENIEVEHPAPPTAITDNNGTTVAPTDSAAPTNQDEEFTYGLQQIGLPEYLDQFDAQGNNTDVVILDNGINEAHPDIDAEKTVRINNSNIQGPSTLGDHGQHVSGTAVGTADPAGNVPRYSVAPGANLYHADFFFGTATTDDILRSMQWSINTADAEVIGGSFGVPSPDARNTWRAVIDEAIDNAKAAGAVVTISAGNSGSGADGGPVTSPATEFGSVAVGATNSDGDVAGFSSGGIVSEFTTLALGGEPFPDTYPREYIAPDVAAPGVDVLSAGPLGGGGFTEPGGSPTYSPASGTSMAQPHVAGAAAILQSVSTVDLTPDQIEAALAATADNPTNVTRDIRYGTGIIDLPAAANAVTNFTTIQGQITDNETGEPIAGAEVRVSDTGQLTTTNENGEYSINVLGDSVTLEVEKFGYDDVDRTFSNLAGSSAVQSDLTPTQTDPVAVGDVNEDGSVTISDAINIQRFVLGLDPGTPFNETVADVNRDGTIEIADAIDTQRIALGIADATLSVSNLTAPQQATVDDTIEVTAEVENTGGVGAIEAVEFRAAPTGSPLTTNTTLAEQVVDLAPDGDTQTVTFTLPGDALGAGEFNHGVFTESDNETAALALEPGLNGDFTLDPQVETALPPTGPTQQSGQPQAAAVGDTFELVVDVAQAESLTVAVDQAISDIAPENVRVRLNGERILGDTVEFEDRFTGVATLEIETTAQVANGTDLALTHTFDGPGGPVEVTTGPTIIKDELQPATFELSNFEATGDFRTGEPNTPYEANVTVTNTGDETATKTVLWFVGPVSLVNPQTATLAPGESTTISNSFDLTSFFPGPTVEVQGFETEDDSVTTTYDVVQANDSAFSIAALDAPDEAEPGDEISVTATIENLGEEGDTQLADLRFAGTIVDSQEASLGSFQTGLNLGQLLPPDFEAGNPGVYSTLGFPFTQVSFTAEVPETTGTFTHSVTIADDTASAQIDVVPANGTVTGTVTDDRLDEPVENVTITAENQNGTVFETTTAADGTYNLDLPADTYTVNPTDTPDGFEADAIIEVDAGETVEQNFTVVGQAPSITGQVVSEQTGDPIAGATVTDADTGKFSATTNANGTYTIERSALDAGVGETVAVRASADGFETSEITFIELGFGANEADFTLTGTSPTFDVSALDPTEAAVGPDQTLNISATVTNTGAAAGTQDVELRLEPDADAVKTQSLSLAVGEDQTVTFEDVAAPNPGEFNHTIASSNDSASGDLSVIDASVTLADQESEDQAVSVTVAEATASVPYVIAIHEANVTDDNSLNFEIRGTSEPFNASETADNVTVELDEDQEAFTQTQEITAMLHRVNESEPQNRGAGLGVPGFQDNATLTIQQAEGGNVVFDDQALGTDADGTTSVLAQNVTPVDVTTVQQQDAFDPQNDFLVLTDGNSVTDGEFDVIDAIQLSEIEDGASVALNATGATPGEHTIVLHEPNENGTGPDPTAPRTDASTGETVSDSATVFSAEVSVNNQQFEDNTDEIVVNSSLSPEISDYRVVVHNQTGIEPGGVGPAIGSSADVSGEQTDLPVNLNDELTATTDVLVMIHFPNGGGAIPILNGDAFGRGDGQAGTITDTATIEIQQAEGGNVVFQDQALGTDTDGTPAVRVENVQPVDVATVQQQDAFDPQDDFLVLTNGTSVNSADEVLDAVQLSEIDDGDDVVLNASGATPGQHTVVLHEPNDAGDAPDPNAPRTDASGNVVNATATVFDGDIAITDQSFVGSTDEITVDSSDLQADGAADYRIVVHDQSRAGSGPTPDDVGPPLGFSELLTGSEDTVRIDLGQNITSTQDVLVMIHFPGNGSPGDAIPVLNGSAFGFGDGQAGTITDTARIKIQQAENGSVTFNDQALGTDADSTPAVLAENVQPVDVGNVLNPQDDFLVLTNGTSVNSPDEVLDFVQLSEIDDGDDAVLNASGATPGEHTVVLHEPNDAGDAPDINAPRTDANGNIVNATATIFDGSVAITDQSFVGSTDEITVDLSNLQADGAANYRIVVHDQSRAGSGPTPDDVGPPLGFSGILNGSESTITISLNQNITSTQDVLVMIHFPGNDSPGAAIPVLNDSAFGFGDGQAGTITDTATVEINEPANFAVSINDGASTTTVATGNDAVLNATIENTGDLEGTQTINFTVNGSTEDSQEITVGGGESTTVEFNYTTEANDDGATATVASDDDNDSTQLRVAEPGKTTVSINNDESTLAGDEADEFSVTATVENVGEQSVSQTVAVVFNGRTIASEPVNLDGGQSETVTLEFIAQADYGGTNLIVETANDNVSTQPLSVTDKDLIDTGFAAADGSVEGTLLLDGVDVGGSASTAEYNTSTSGADTNQVVAVFGDNANETTRFELDGQQVLVDFFEDEDGVVRQERNKDPVATIELRGGFDEQTVELVVSSTSGTESQDQLRRSSPPIMP